MLFKTFDNEVESIELVDASFFLMAAAHNCAAVRPWYAPSPYPFVDSAQTNLFSLWTGPYEKHC